MSNRTERHSAFRVAILSPNVSVSPAPTLIDSAFIRVAVRILSNVIRHFDDDADRETCVPHSGSFGLFGQCVEFNHGVEVGVLRYRIESTMTYIHDATLLEKPHRDVHLRKR